MTKISPQRIAGVLLILYCAIAVLHIAHNKDLYQWDFFSYYECAKAHTDGVSPYDTRAVSERAGRRIYPFVYPPIVLLLFRLFTMIDYSAAFYLFLVIKCILAAALICLWRNAFLGKRADIVFYLLCLFAFNSAFYLDLRAGNISIVEQLLIWVAFYYYTKRAYPLFCAFIVISSLLKVQPILFLSLLLVADTGKKYQYIAGSLLAFGAILFWQYITSPDLFLKFLVNATSRMNESGITNPSTFSFIRDLLRLLTGASNARALDVISLSFCLLAGAIVILVSRRAYKRLAAARHLTEGEKERWSVYFACFVYALVTIRFKDYSYILLILPAYYIIKRTSGVAALGALSFLVCISAVHTTLPWSGILIPLFWDYYPLIVSSFLWSMYLFEIHRAQRLLPPLPDTQEPPAISPGRKAIF